MVADNIYFGDSKRDGDSGGSGFARPAAPAPVDYGIPSGSDDQFAELTDDDGDLPF